KTGLKDINFLQICLWLSVVKLIITGGYGMAAGQLNVHMNGTAWIMTLLLALLAGIGAMSLFQIGVRYSGASNAAIFSMLEPVTSLIVGFFFMNEHMTALKWLGCVLILLGIVMTVLDEKK
ncbi:MAG: DMT family transporter, partial [Clostridiales bacterium]|nr:DMT family transporter [Clostridiales bacterium]